MHPITLHNIAGHITTITAHKREVMRLMFKVGLYRQGLLHDMSKYSVEELISGFQYYQGTRSPNAAEREDLGYSAAWLHHKGRNKHHFEYWTDMVGSMCKLYANDRASSAVQGIEVYGIPMPTRYVVEMFCDRVAASKTYQGQAYTDASALEYFQREVGSTRFVMHADTQALLLVLLEMLAEHGEDVTLRFIRESIVKPRFCQGVQARF